MLRIWPVVFVCVTFLQSFRFIKKEDFIYKYLQIIYKYSDICILIKFCNRKRQK